VLGKLGETERLFKQVRLSNSASKVQAQKAHSVQRVCTSK